MKTAKLFIAAIAASMSMVPLPASAGPPDECRSQSGRHGYSQGHSYETRFLEFLWRQHFDCDTLEDFQDSVGDPPILAQSSSRYLECRNIGIIDALYATLKDKLLECGRTCFDNGAAIGDSQAGVYCGLPPWQPRTFEMEELHICEVTTEEACEAALRTHVDRHCAWKAADDPTFDDFVDHACQIVM